MGVVFVADAAPQCNRDTLSLVLYVKAFQCISPALLKSLAFAMHRKNWEVNAVSVHFKVWFLPEQNCKRALFIGRGYCTGWCSCRFAHEGAAAGPGPPQAVAAAAVALAAAGVHRHL